MYQVWLDKAKSLLQDCSKITRTPKSSCFELAANLSYNLISWCIKFIANWRQINRKFSSVMTKVLQIFWKLVENLPSSCQKKKLRNYCWVVILSSHSIFLQLSHCKINSSMSINAYTLSYMHSQRVYAPYLSPLRNKGGICTVKFKSCFTLHSK